MSVAVLDPKAPTLARILHQNGYATGHFGKWHFGGQRDVDDAPPITAYSFDESLTNFEDMEPKLLPLTMRPGDTQPGKIWDDAERLGKPVTWMQRSKITSGLIDAAIPFIDKAAAAKKPFFVNLWPDDVHGPWRPPVEKWAEGKRGIYLAVLEEMDRQFGQLFDHIRSNPELRDNTLLLICSDNGPEPGAGSAGPFRGSKTTLYEGGTRSPLIVWAPGLNDKTKAGSVNTTSIFAAFDIAPFHRQDRSQRHRLRRRKHLARSSRPKRCHSRCPHLLASPTRSQNRFRHAQGASSRPRHA